MSESTPEDAETSQDEPVDRLADLLYTVVGFGVLAVNRVQVARRSAQAGAAGTAANLPGTDDLRALLSDPQTMRNIAVRLRDELQDLDNAVGGFDNRVNSLLDDIETELPENATWVTDMLRTVADDHIVQMRSIVGLEVR
ncbi:MAG: hypothetical protein ACR2PK_04715 [Acidimicrobiales bacterium]